LTRSTLILIPALLAWSGTAVAGVSSRAARHIAGKDRHLDQACVETRAIVSAIGKELYYAKSIFVDGPPTPARNSTTGKASSSTARPPAQSTS